MSAAAAPVETYCAWCEREAGRPPRPGNHTICPRCLLREYPGETTGERIRQLRRARDLTQHELAAALAPLVRVPVAANAVCAWERDRRQPRRLKLRALAKALRCDLAWLDCKPGAPTPAFNGRARS